MTIEGESEQAVHDAMARLLAGRDPRPCWLTRSARGWKTGPLLVRNVGQRRRIVISGRLKSDRFTVREVDVACVPVLWMDRKWRFGLTAHGMRNLGTRLVEKADD